MEKDQELIAGYLEGSLSNAERTKFAERLKDENFQEALALEASIIEAVKQEGTQFEEDLLQDIDLDNIDETLKQELRAQGEKIDQRDVPISKMRRIRRFWSMAAAIAVLVVGLAVVWMSNQYSNEVLAGKAIFEADLPGTLSGNGTQVTSEETLNFGLQAYKRGDFNAAVDYFNSIGEEEVLFPDAQYFLSYTYFRSERLEEAIKALETTLAQPDLPAYMVREKLEWNLMMMQLAQGQNVDQQIEDYIKQDKPPYAEKAKALKDQLESTWRKLPWIAD